MAFAPRGNTLADRILGYLRERPGGASDSEIRLALGAVNVACRNLEARGAIQRRRVDGPIKNYLSGDTTRAASSPTPTVIGDERPWYWEGNVQSRIVSWLAATDWCIAILPVVNPALTWPPDATGRNSW